MNEHEQTNKAIDPANMDTAYTPGQDFYLYANGTWITENPLPEEYTQYGAFTELREKNREDLKKLVLEAAEATDAKLGSIQKKIGDFYKSGMDTVAIDAAGITPLQPYFEKIAAIENTKDLVKVMTEMQINGLSPWFYVFSRADQDNSDWVIANIWQGGLGLPDRDYYLSDDPRSTDMRIEYVKHIARMLELAGQDAESAKADAETNMKIEIRLAEASNTRLENRDPLITKNKMKLDSLQEIAQNIDWTLYFETLGLGDPGEFNINQPGFITELSTMIEELPLKDWKAELKWSIINNTAGYLSSDFEQANFDFYSNYLSGQKKMKPRWKRIVSATNGAMSDAIGKRYVEVYFPPAAKERMEVLVGYLKKSLSNRIDKLEWMTDETKLKAHEKLGAMGVKIGYPNKWKDYDKLIVSADSYLENISNTGRFYFEDDVSKINKPLDKEEWVMSPQTVNAGYVPTMNEIIFPAGILQPPFFFMDADDAVNYGAIGVVIGHEMTHGFDDKGRLFDKEGNLADWWTEIDAESFEKQSQTLVDQFSSFVILDSLFVDGKLTLGENIADLGGMNISFDAFMEAIKDEKNEPVHGFTPEQRFFLSYAQLWRNNITDKELMNRLKEDVHSPGIARVNGAIKNMDQFYEAFGVKEGDPMFIATEERAKVW
jgi:putative endopeptidase